MQLGEQIYSLRTAKGLSQSELADALGVSRQSVSKWETGTSIPDLDKLVKLSRLFDVTLDQLVQGTPETVPAPSVPQAAAPPSQPPAAPWKTGGICLLVCGGVLALLLALVLGLWGVLFSTPLLVCGVICLTARRHPGLGCVWTFLGMVDTYLYLATSASWSLVFLTFRHASEMAPFSLIASWGMLLWRLVLVPVTARRLGRTGKAPSRRTLRLGALLLLLLCIPISIPASLLSHTLLIQLFLLVRDWCQLLLVTALLTGVIRACRKRLEKTA